jgi:hypothetical protein
MADAAEPAPPLTPETFYAKLVEEQRAIVANRSYKAFCQTFVDDLADTRRRQTEESDIHLKRFYQAQCLFAASASAPAPTFRSSYVNFRAADLKGSSPPIGDGLTEAALLKRIVEAKSPAKLDRLTFSTVPSFFRFFMFKANCDAFLAFLPKITEPLIRHKISRVVFVSPQFLRFLERVGELCIQPAIDAGVDVLPAATVLDSKAARAAGRLNLLDATTTAIGEGLCPEFVVRVIQMVHADLKAKFATHMRDHLWAPVFADQERFLVCGLHPQRPARFFAEADAILKGNTLSIVNEALEDAPVCLRALPDDANCANVWLYDTFDLKPDAKGELQFDLVSVIGDPIPRHIPGPETMFNNDLVALTNAFRALLKQSPALVANAALERVTPTEVIALASPRDIIKAFLVDNAALSNLASQTAHFETLTRLIGPALAESKLGTDEFALFALLLRDIRVVHHEALTVFAEDERLRDQVSAWRKFVAPPLQTVPTYLHRVVLAREDAAAAKRDASALPPEERAARFVRDPAEFDRALAEMAPKFTHRDWNGLAVPALQVGAVSGLVRFALFKRANPHLQALDQALVHGMREEAQLATAPELRADQLPIFDDVQARLRAACESNTDPIGKCDKLLNVHRAIFLIFRLNTGQEPLGDTRAELLYTIYCRACPPSLASAIAFLFTFVLEINNADLHDEQTRELTSDLEILFRRLPLRDKAHAFRTLSRRFTHSAGLLVNSDRDVLAALNEPRPGPDGETPKAWRVGDTVEFAPGESRYRYLVTRLPLDKVGQPGPEQLLLVWIMKPGLRQGRQFDIAVSQAADWFDKGAPKAYKGPVTKVFISTEAGPPPQGLVDKCDAFKTPDAIDADYIEQICSEHFQGLV